MFIWKRLGEVLDRELLAKINKAHTWRQATIIVTNIADGTQRLIAEGEAVDGELADAVQKAFLTGKSGLLEIGGQEVFLNVQIPPPRLVVIGAVHISQALAQIAKTAGYALEVIDPRTAFATPERFENTELFAEWPEDVLTKRPLDSYCALIAVTHDPKIDDYPILSALKSNCFYVGALGSRKTHGTRLERLKASGASEEELSCIHAPIGLDIGASNPQEIAIAIMAEIVRAFRTRGV